jgi:hypothetical protein
MPLQMTMSQDPEKLPLFEPPELVINETVLAGHLGLEINAENFPTLIASNFLMALDARDHKLTRENFEEVMVMAFNFQNRLIRVAELNTVLEYIEAGKGVEEIKLDISRHLASAKTHQASLLRALQTFGQMRGPEDPVS